LQPQAGIRQTCELILNDAIAMTPYASTDMSNTLRSTLVCLTTVAYAIIVRVLSEADSWRPMVTFTGDTENIFSRERSHFKDDSIT